MCRSKRNELVQSIYEMLMYAVVGDVPEHLTDAGVKVFQRGRVESLIGSNGTPFVIELTALDEQGDYLETVISLQGCSPVMSLVCKLDDPETDGYDLFAGESRLKEGDKWDALEGYKICCTRAARHLASIKTVPLDNEIASLRDQAEQLFTQAEYLSEMFYGAPQ